MSYSNDLFIRITPKNNHEPKSLETKFVCLPCHPNPAFSANGFSMIGAVSTNTLIFVSFSLFSLDISLLESSLSLPFMSW